ncbi:MAG: hypothetical protein GY943_30315, partial [Chloroflexi bacterium]|nr:hypothetical protein [Chloroflexota bacterium]
PVRTDPDIYDWGTPATTPTTTTATAPATTLAPLDDDMSYRLGGTPATRPAVNPMTVKDPDPFAGYPISPAKRADTAPAVSSWTGGGVAGPGPASLIDIIKGRTGGAVTGLLDSLLSPTPPTPIDPARQASIAQANITNPTAHAIPGGGVNYSGASANFPGMDIAVTNPFGVTTVMDDNMSFIDNTGKAGGLFGGGLLGGLFSPSAPATEADPNSPGSAGGGIGGADGGGGGGNKVLCTHYHRIGWLDDETYAHDVLYGLQISPEIRAGYHQWAIPLVRALTRHKWLERAVWPPVWLWAHSMANPDKWWSRALRWTGETICKLIAPKRRYAYGAR